MTRSLIFILIFLICFTGSALQTVAGFGFVMIAMALMPTMLPVAQCVVLSQIGGVLMCLWILWGKFRLINWREVFFPTLFASLGSLAGLRLFSGISTAAYMKALGALLIVLALWMWKLSAKVEIKRGLFSGGVCGVLGGAMGALFGISVPPLVLYYSSGMKEKDSYIVPLQITLCIQTLVCIIGRRAFGMWPEGVWPMAPAVIAGMVLGKFPGKWIYDKLDLDKFKLMIYIMIALLGIYTILSN